MNNLDCIFCKIINKEIPANIVYEDETFVAFLDIRPVREGHLLIVPKVHEPIFFNLDKVIYQNLFELARKLASVLDITFSPIRIGLAIVGFDVSHTHIHIIPMFDYHDITSKPILDGTHIKPTQEEFSQTVKKIKTHL